MSVLPTHMIGSYDDLKDVRVDRSPEEVGVTEVDTHLYDWRERPTGHHHRR
jgi:hypothetical protein